MHCEHEHDDGAYVLGALSPTERAAYERHLATCSFCREAVADISALPDLLSRLDAKEFAELLDPSLSSGTIHPPARNSRPEPIKSGKALRVRILSSAAAAVLAMLIGVGVVAWTRDGTPAAAPAVAMTAMEAGSPVAATVRLTNTPGGTKVDMACSYSRAAGRSWTFRLIAYGRSADGQDQLGSWAAAPGEEVSMDVVTHFGRGSLSRLEVVRSDGRTMLAYDVP
ncbi:anti-sigma factor family protein [Micromonosporaceae bacterium Da 78-11]